MTPAASLRMDALRAVAALAVFVTHFAQLGFSWGNSESLWLLGRFGVIAFFVLSGYVIAYAAREKHPSFAPYLQARLARLYSVFLPALLLTVLLDAAGRALAPTLYARFPVAADARTLLQFPFFVTFLFENAWFSLRWLSNGPMWSLAYEFWYYMVFGLIVYLPRRQLLPVAAAALVLAGWKVMLLAPIWLAGVLIYHAQQRTPLLGPSIRKLLFGCSVALLVFLFSPWGTLAVVSLRLASADLVPAGFHAVFLCDYVLALPCICLVAAVSSSPATGPPPVLLRRLVAWAAGFSFSLYLYHVPLILFLRASGVYDAGSLVQGTLAALFVIFLCQLLARFTEHRKAFWLRVVAVASELPRVAWGQVRAIARGSTRGS